MFNVNVKKARFALKNALLLTHATSAIIFMAISIILRLYGVIPPDLPIEEVSLDYYWANLSLYAQIFSWVFVITLIQITIAKKINNYEKSSYRIERESVKS